MADKELDLRLPPIGQSESSPRRDTYRTPRTEASMTLPPLSYRSAQSFDPRRPTYHSHVVYGSPLWHRDSVQTTIKPLPSSDVFKSLEVGFVNDAVKTAIFTRPRKIPIIPDYIAEQDKCARAYFKSPMVQDTIARTSKMIIKDTEKNYRDEEIFITQLDNAKLGQRKASNERKDQTSKSEAKTGRVSIKQRMLPIETADTLPSDDHTGTGPSGAITEPPTDGNDSDSDYGHPGGGPAAPPVDKVTNLPVVETDSKPGSSDEAATLPIVTEGNLPEDNTETKPAAPGDNSSTQPVDTVGNLPVNDQQDKESGKHRPGSNNKYLNLWPDENYSTEYRGLPEFIVRLYTEEYDVRGKRPTVNKLSIRHRCRSTPNADDLNRLETEFVNDAIITERKRTKYKDIIPPYDASRDKNARAYFMREDVKHLLGVTRSAR